MFGAPCFGLIGYLWNIPSIGVSTTSLYPWLHRSVAQPESLSFVPNNCLSFINPMNFWQRVYNVLHTAYFKWIFSSTSSLQDDIIREHFGPGMPSVRELEKRMAIVLVNSHISLNGIKPVTPAVVDVGGLHVYDEGLTLRPVIPSSSTFRVFLSRFFFPSSANETLKLSELPARQKLLRGQKSSYTKKFVR